MVVPALFPPTVFLIVAPLCVSRVSVGRNFSFLTQGRVIECLLACDLRSLRLRLSLCIVTGRRTRLLVTPAAWV